MEYEKIFSLYWLLGLVTNLGKYYDHYWFTSSNSVIITGHKPYFMGPQMFFKFGTGWGGVNFGPIAIVCSNASINTEYHEAGHGLQNLIWGPLMPFVVSIPSAIRYWYRDWVYRKDKKMG